MSSPLVLARTGVTLADQIVVATTALERLRGLLGYREPPQRTAFLIPRAKQVHTFTMRFPIDVIFCDGEGHIVHLVETMRPYRLSRWVRRAHWTFELHAGAADGARVGDLLTWAPPGREESA